MTVQELYDLAHKKGNPKKIEIRVHPDNDEIAEVEIKEADSEISACLIVEGCIHL